MNDRRQNANWKSRSGLTTIVVVLLTLHAARSTLGQGPLTPPGGPAPTMKTLQQVEPRIAITNTTAVTINAPGSYYLTGNLTVVTGNAITITTDNVTLDLNGFTVSSTAASATGTGILLSGGRRQIHIMNGHITGSVTYSGGIYSGGGFGYGISYSGDVPGEVRVSNISVRGCLYNGIELYNDATTLVESCTVHTVGSTGIRASTVKDSVAIRCGGDAIWAWTASNCRGESTGNSSGVAASVTVINCYGSSDTGIGLYSEGSAHNCYGTSTSGTGLSVATASNCYGDSGSGSYGLHADTAINSKGTTSSSGTGLDVTNATNCQGNSVSGIGLNADNASSCYGYSISGTGLNANNAGDSYGQSNTSAGLNADSASNCRGYSNSGNGLYAGSVMNSYGGTGSGSYGIYTSRANNCYGFNGGSGTGLRAVYTAIGCRGYSTSGTGLHTAIANSCVGTGSPALTVANKYNMP